MALGRPVFGFARSGPSFRVVCGLDWRVWCWSDLVHGGFSIWVAKLLRPALRGWIWGERGNPKSGFSVIQHWSTSYRGTLLQRLMLHTETPLDIVMFEITDQHHLLTNPLEHGMTWRLLHRSWQVFPVGCQVLSSYRYHPPTETEWNTTFLFMSNIIVCSSF